MEQVTINIKCDSEKRIALLPRLIPVVKGPEFKHTIELFGDHDLIVLVIRSYKSTVKIRRTAFKVLLEDIAEDPRINLIAYRFYDQHRVTVLGREADDFWELEYLTP